MTDTELIQKARGAMARAYAPYSNFRVGACVLTDDGRAFIGCNVENASYGLSICAERAAVVSAIAAGATRIVKVAVASDDGMPWPCGACRQVLSEFGGDMTVICASPDKTESERLGALLPNTFTLNTEAL